MEQDVDIAIVGGGLAALTAGMFAARLGHSATILTGLAPGGLLLSIEQIEGVPGFPEGVPGYDLCPIAQEQAEEAGAGFVMAEADGLDQGDDGWIVRSADGDVRARAVVLASGSRLKHLGVPGEAEFAGHGVSHCASCDAPLLRDKTVVVVGGGDSALQEALTLAGPVAHVIVLERGDALTAQETFRRRALEHPDIEVRHGVEVTEIVGNGTVTGVRTTAGDIDCSAVFAYVGLEPNTGFLDGSLAFDDDGRVPTDARLRTELPGVFAAGSVRGDTLYQAAIAAGDGAAAAKSAHRYLADSIWRNGGSS
jgi:thioredoxin reductase (NADPH)